MNKEEAINLIIQVCAAYRGTLQEHKLIQEAINLIIKELNIELKE